MSMEVSSANLPALVIDSYLKCQLCVCVMQDLAQQPKVRMKLALKVQQMIEVLGSARVEITFPVPSEEVLLRTTSTDKEAANHAEDAAEDEEGESQAVRAREKKSSEHKTDEASQPIERWVSRTVPCS